MPLTESKVDEPNQYISSSYSSGDNRGTVHENKHYYKEENKNMYKKEVCTDKPYEENNNELDEITKEFSEMGCIVDAVKRPPNICVETCVYEEPDCNDDHDKPQTQNNDEEINYSDEFEEEDLSETELEKPKTKTVINSSESNEHVNKSSSKSTIKLSKSQSCPSQCTSHKPGSVSGKSSDYGSVSVPQTRRINMSFTNDRLREIERHNHILLNKILSARNKRQSSVPARAERPRKPPPPAALLRRNQQRQIDHDNMILLKKIQRAKSSACSVRR